MNRTLVFTKRNLLEMSRDALSYIFCIAFPVVMLVIMSVVNASIPKEAGMTIFRIDNLAGGIAIFGQTFVMLFTAINVAKDRSGSFLVRLYASPMKGRDFALGYILPMLAVALVQVLISFTAAVIVAFVSDTEIEIRGLLIAAVAVLPSALMFTATGFLIGTLFNEKAAPGICSIIISLGSFIGGIWFDVDKTGGVMLDISRCTPFYYATKTARSAIHLDFASGDFAVPLIIVTASALALTALAVWVFERRMRTDMA
ncbi:MAG: ABC transporter permease [Lachnospiraceae bacterium]|nr:ABC transporter permease [Lachnospiraceae bacterium]